MSPVPYLGFIPGTAEYTKLEIRVYTGWNEFPKLGLGYTPGRIIFKLGLGNIGGLEV